MHINHSIWWSYRDYAFNNCLFFQAFMLLKVKYTADVFNLNLGQWS